MRWRQPAGTGGLGRERHREESAEEVPWFKKIITKKRASTVGYKDESGKEILAMSCVCLSAPPYSVQPWELQTLTNNLHTWMEAASRRRRFWAPSLAKYRLAIETMTFFF